MPRRFVAATANLLPVLGINAVPVGGVLLAGWSAGTALSLYWWENLIGSLLVAVRIAVHRALTRTRGHQRLQLSLESNPQVTDGRGGRHPRPRRDGARQGSFLLEFLIAACLCTAIHGLLLWALLRQELVDGPGAAALRQGVLAVAGFQLLGLAFDLFGIRRRPFAWIRDVAQAAFARVTLIHLVLIVGFWFAVSRGGVSSFFAPFAVIKALADVGNALHRLGLRVDPDEAPSWLVATMNRMRPGHDFGEHWREQQRLRRQLAMEDEEVAQ
jgi:hypothetical protein